MRALTRSEQTRLRASGLPALGVALVLASAFLFGLLAATRARVGDLLFAARPVQAARSTVIVGIDELGDGFNGGNVPMASVAPLVKEVKDAAAARGKDPAKLHIRLPGHLPRPRQPAGARIAARSGARWTRSARTSGATPRPASPSSSSRATSPRGALRSIRHSR